MYWWQSRHPRRGCAQIHQRLLLELEVLRNGFDNKVRAAEVYGLHGDREAAEELVQVLTDSSLLNGLGQGFGDAFAGRFGWRPVPSTTATCAPENEEGVGNAGTHPAVAEDANLPA